MLVVTTLCVFCYLA